MKFLTLNELRQLFINLKEGESRSLAISGEITQEAASAFASEVNGERNGHVWIEVGQVAYIPGAPVTEVRVRCSY